MVSAGSEPPLRLCALKFSKNMEFIALVSWGSVGMSQNFLQIIDMVSGYCK